MEKDIPGSQEVAGMQLPGRFVGKGINYNA